MVGIKRIAAACLASLCIGAAAQAGTTFTFADKADGQNGLQLAAPAAPPTILISANELGPAVRAARDLAVDFGRVLGKNATVSTATTLPKSGDAPAIIVGTLGSSVLIDQLVKAGQLDDSAIKGKWEAYASQVVTGASGEPIALAIAGSDVRGTIFGIYDISQQIGVSPWHFWADVPPKKRQYIFAPTVSKVYGPPSVKYRGLFINDEAPALSNWVKGRFPSGSGGNSFTAPFYAHVLELLLRLKGNYFWPAMWGKMFYLDDPENGPQAHAYGVFVGTSHHEPMARSDAEQSRYCQPWDWTRNKANIQRFMTEGVIRSKSWETIYTLGMRGSGDAASATLNSRNLEEVIKWQQSALTTSLGKALSEIPQTWVMYKEVPGYWQRGMDVSEDVTLLWTDDNRGNIRRIPTAKENSRKGGAGMYYHFDYVGAPRNYKWINTIQLQKTWEQMHLAYDRGIRNIWIANVGDLKALELPLDHFMAMAYDMSKFSTPEDTGAYLINWAAEQFTPQIAEATAQIMTTYGKLCARRKYEDLSTQFGFSTSEYDEAETNFQEWLDLLEAATETYNSLPDEPTKISFWQMVLHPVRAGKNVFEIYTNAALGGRYASERRLATNELADRARAAFEDDKALQRQFDTILGGKWNHMMDQTHIGYNNWQEPPSNSMPRLPTLQGGGSGFGVGIQGSGSSGGGRITTLPMTPFMAPTEKRWVDVFLRARGSLKYTIKANATFANITNSDGSLTDAGPSQLRAVVGIDWTKAPAGRSAVELTISSGSSTVTVIVPLQNTPAPPEEFEGHIEANGIVSVEANHFVEISTNNTEVGYAVIPDYGRTLAGVKLWPVTAPVQTVDKGPALVYRFYTYSTAAQAKATVYLSASENADSENANKYALSIDGKTPIVVQPTPNSSDAGSEPPGWDMAVIRNAWIRDSNLGRLEPGAHELKLWLLNPTMVLTKIVLDVGGVKNSELGPPESYRTCAGGVAAADCRLNK
ncbi:hypothetical protein MFIFM68171_05661 [Madurella fahalii]|uniref:Gylcosyl hydrolase 115 C-terminal domain-containing protein n=1 Tax=Madurella fahalii TaxID=1157608 RepID=A0ABQ0GCF6_9PEZI